MDFFFLDVEMIFVTFLSYIYFFLLLISVSLFTLPSICVCVCCCSIIRIRHDFPCTGFKGLVHRSGQHNNIPLEMETKKKNLFEREMKDILFHHRKLFDSCSSKNFHNTSEQLFMGLMIPKSRFILLTICLMASLVAKVFS